MKKKNRAEFINFNQLGDERGRLVVLEGNIDIPFEIKRVFYIYDSNSDVIRGQHANRKSEFVLINVCGNSKVKIDYGDNHEIYEMKVPHTGIYIPQMVWKDMYDFSEDSVLMVLASEKFDPTEYIRDYDDYLEEIKKLNNIQVTLPSKLEEGEIINE